MTVAIAEGDGRWRAVADYGVAPALKPAGYLAAQFSYWWLQERDKWKAWRQPHR